MAAIRSFVRREPVLLIAALAALLSCCFVPPDVAYLDYMDYRTLALLYCLMTVVAGLRKAGLFAFLAHRLCENVKSVRMIGLVLVLLCFFSAMLITNDVALLTFVPFAVVVLGMADRKKDPGAVDGKNACRSYCRANDGRGLPVRSLVYGSSCGGTQR